MKQPKKEGDSFFLAACLSEALKHVFISEHPFMPALRDQVLHETTRKLLLPPMRPLFLSENLRCKVLTSFLMSLVMAQEVKYREQKKKGSDLKTKNRVWMEECGLIIGSGAPVLYKAYRESRKFLLLHFLRLSPSTTPDAGRRLCDQRLILQRGGAPKYPTKKV
jgi:hypothetical protein